MENSNIESVERICPACGVRIEQQTDHSTGRVVFIVHYSFGKPQNLAHLAAKVCQHKKVEPPCINQHYNKQDSYPSFLDF